MLESKTLRFLALQRVEWDGVGDVVVAAVVLRPRAEIEPLPLSYPSPSKFRPGNFVTSRRVRVVSSICI